MERGKERLASGLGVLKLFSVRAKLDDVARQSGLIATLSLTVANQNSEHIESSKVLSAPCA
jgi:hypothetical protein